MPTSSEIKELCRDTLNLIVLSVGVLSGIGQLLQFSEGLGRLVLQLILAVSLLFVITRVWFVYFLKYHWQQKKRLEEAVERVSDREKPYFDETLTVIVTIGADDDGDEITERRRTNPHRRVNHLTMRPIVPEEKRVRLDGIAFEAKLTKGVGTITALPLRVRAGFLRVWLVFETAMVGPTDWEVRYRPRGLWRPLRKRGYDVLKWDDRLPRADGAPSALTDFTVRFRFPKGERQPSVTELNGWGFCASPEAGDSGGWDVTWRDENPVGRRYVWELTQPPA